ncbi:hypothetical protein [Bradyrhizobium sp. CCBAU 11434]|uniref:hypothetical protein n=1 Tax=Bradyrhizobium sp. CCBAU 11434 TaxID=1630885 RepID=UPI00230617A0|nr:hypothetical protein [Bradyrhizobium sp. CCBAU 11434]
MSGDTGAGAAGWHDDEVVSAGLPGKNPGLELISRVVAADSMVLVTINLDRDEQGRYHS